MTTITSVLKANIRPFSHEDSRMSPRGTRIYDAPTWLQSDGPNGRYQIEQLSPSMWVVTHYQVIRRGAEVVNRRVGIAVKTKTAAIALAEHDSANLANNVLSAVLIAGPQCFAPNPEADSFVMPRYSAVI